MIITLAGHHGAGKSTLSRALALRYQLATYSAGGMMRELAFERGESLIDLGREAEQDGGAIDRLLDDRTILLGKTQDNFVIDGRLAFYCIPHSCKLFLSVSPEEAARRIFQDASRAHVETHDSIDHAVENIRIRRENENARYKKYYNVDIYDLSQYDAIIATDHLSVDEVLAQAIKAIDDFYKNGADSLV